LNKAAAAQGLAMAEENVGTAYEWGRGVDADYAAAARWYRLAAEKGEASAQAKLGNLLFEGKGVVADRKKACDLWRTAAASGQDAAAHNMQSNCTSFSAAN